MKKLFLVRGLLGEGNSNLVRTLAHKDDQIIDNDYMVSQYGDYILHHVYVEEMHIKSQACVADAMSKGVERIFSIKAYMEPAEMDPYFDLAHEHTYEVFTFIVENRDGLESLQEVPEPTRK